MRRADPIERGWAGNAAAAAALIGVLTTVFSTGNRAPAALVSAAAVAGYLVALRWRPPTPLLVVWTYGPPVAALLRHRGESLVFLIMVGVSYLVLLEDDRRLRFGAGLLAVAAPAAVQLVVRDDWGWPFWTGGLLVTWLSAEQLRRSRALVAELEATRERLAEQAVHLERRRIAAELHDLVGHSLGVLLLHVTGARRRIGDDPAGAEEALRRAESIGRAGLAEIRRSVAALRDEAGTSLAPATTAADLPALVATTAAARGQHLRQARRPGPGRRDRLRVPARDRHPLSLRPWADGPDRSAGRCGRAAAAGRLGPGRRDLPGRRRG